MLAKITSKNQLTLPKEVVKDFPDVKYFDVTVKDSNVVLVPVRITPVGEPLEEIRDKMEKLGISEKDVLDAVEWLRKKKKNKAI